MQHSLFHGEKPILTDRLLLLQVSSAESFFLGMGKKKWAKKVKLFPKSNLLRS